MLSELNDLQTLAVTSNEKRLLVLAGAGSGKTKTLIQKINYLIEEKGIRSDQILAITFSKNAAVEMLDRLIISADSSGLYEQTINDKRLSNAIKEDTRRKFQKKFKWINLLTVRTFHSLCYFILRENGVSQFDNKFKIIGKDRIDPQEDLQGFQAPISIYDAMQNMMTERCHDTGYLLKLKRYILDYFVDVVHKQNENQKPLHPDGRIYTSLNGIRVRSKSELYIADWLYRHQIAFEYEPTLTIKNFPSHPDFYIPQANLYIEHVSELSRGVAEKEIQYIHAGLMYAYTYEVQTRDSSSFNKVLEGLIKSRINDRHETFSPIYFREEFSSYYKELSDFVNMVIRVMDMMKVDGLNLQEIAKKGSVDQHERVKIFYELAVPLIEDFQQFCIEKSYLDFNDLITQCIALLKNDKSVSDLYKNKYNYILVDEFQDVNSLQVELVKQLLNSNSQLFCVGDDWQSIYGFRGSNVDYILQFEKHFPGSKTIKLSLNYRSTESIVEASNELIKHNRFQIEKELKSSKRSENKILVFSAGSREDALQFCSKKVHELQNMGYGKEDILFLYRRSAMFEDYRGYFHKHGVFVSAKTIHASKGLESKAVFIIGLSEGKGGFPDVWLEDRIFQVVRKSEHMRLLEEERRLFYVAITRAKERLFLITEKGNESSFIREIPEMYTVRDAGFFKAPKMTRLCKQCESQLEPLWKICPFCGEDLKD